MNLESMIRRAIPTGPGSELPFVLGQDRPSPDWNGYAKLAANQLVRPQLFPIMESASVWTPLTVLDRTIRLYKPGERRTINYVQNPLVHSGLDTLTLGLHAQSSLGYVDLPKGDWLVNTPIVAAEGTVVNFVYQDAALGFAYDPAGSVGLADAGDNLASIGGTAQTGLDLTGKFAPLTMLAPTVNSDIDAVSEEIVAARVGRRYLYVENTSPGGQVLWLAFGANPAVVGSGIRLSPGQSFEQTSLTGVTEQAVNGISSAADGSASVQEGT